MSPKGNVRPVFLFTLLPLLMLGVAGCKVDIEKPSNGAAFTVNTFVEFKAEYDGVGEIKWKSDYTAPDGSSQHLDNSFFKANAVDIGSKGYPWRFKIQTLPRGEHRIIAYKGDDDDDVRVTIQGFCQDPATNCSNLDNGCIHGVCDQTQDKCVAVPDNTTCDDGFGCTNDMCNPDGSCANYSNCEDPQTSWSGRCLEDSTCVFESERIWFPLISGAEEGTLPIVNVIDNEECNPTDKPCVEWEITLRGIWVTYVKKGNDYFYDFDIPGGTSSFVSDGYPEFEEYEFPATLPAGWNSFKITELSKDTIKFQIPRDLLYPQSPDNSFVPPISDSLIPDIFPEALAAYSFSPGGPKGTLRPLYFDKLRGELNIVSHLNLLLQPKEYYGVAYEQKHLSEILNGKMNDLDNIHVTLENTFKANLGARDAKRMKSLYDNGFCLIDSENYDCFINDGMVHRWAPDSEHGCPHMGFNNIFITGDSKLIISNCPDVSIAGDIYLGVGNEVMEGGHCSVPQGACNTAADCIGTGQDMVCESGECFYACANIADCEMNYCDLDNEQCTLTNEPCGNIYCDTACQLNGFCEGTQIPCGSRGCERNLCIAGACSLNPDVACSCPEGNLICPQPKCQDHECLYCVGSSCYDTGYGEYCDNDYQCTPDLCIGGRCSLFKGWDCSERVPCDPILHVCNNEGVLGDPCGNFACEEDLCNPVTGRCSVSHNYCSCSANICVPNPNTNRITTCFLSGRDCGRCQQNKCILPHNFLVNRGELEITDNSTIVTHGIFIRSDKEAVTETGPKPLHPSRAIISNSTVKFSNWINSMVVLGGNSRLLIEKSTLEPLFDKFVGKPDDNSQWELLYNQWFGIWSFGYDFDYQSGSFECKDIANPPLSAAEKPNGAGIWISENSHIVGARFPVLAAGFCLDSSNDYQELPTILASKWKLAPAYSYIHIDGKTDWSIPEQNRTHVYFDIRQSATINMNGMGYYTQNWGVTASMLNPPNLLTTIGGGFEGEADITQHLYLNGIITSYNQFRTFCDNERYVDHLVMGNYFYLYNSNVTALLDKIETEIQHPCTYYASSNAFRNPVFYVYPYITVWGNKQDVNIKYLERYYPAMGPADIYLLDPEDNVKVGAIITEHISATPLPAQANPYKFCEEFESLDTICQNPAYRELSRFKVAVEFTRPVDGCDSIPPDEQMDNPLRTVRMEVGLHNAEFMPSYPEEGYAIVVNSGETPLDNCTQTTIRQYGYTLSKIFAVSGNYGPYIESPIIAVEGITRSSIVRNVHLENLSLGIYYPGFGPTDGQLRHNVAAAGIYLRNVENIDLDSIKFGSPLYTDPASGGGIYYSPRSPILINGIAENVFVHHSSIDFFRWKSEGSNDFACIDTSSSTIYCSPEDCVDYCMRPPNQYDSVCWRDSRMDRCTCTFFRDTNDPLHPCDTACLFGHCVANPADESHSICHRNHPWVPGPEPLKDVKIYCNEFSAGCGATEDQVRGLNNYDFYIGNANVAPDYLTFQGYGNYYHLLNSGITSLSGWYNPADYLPANTSYGVCADQLGRPARVGGAIMPEAIGCYDLDTCSGSGFPLNCSGHKPLYTCAPPELAVE